MQRRGLVGRRLGFREPGLHMKYQENAAIGETENSSQPSVKVSVVLCTYNPRRDFLALALRSVGAQTLPYDDFEVVVVDNNSSPPLDADCLEVLCGRPITLVREKAQGLVHARVAGVKVTSAPLVVFVDDDNELTVDYLENAVGIAERIKELGTFGGVSIGKFEKVPGVLHSPFLPYLGIRDYGRKRIEGPCDEWGPWEPIGAGLVVRREVAEHFVEQVEADAGVDALGRKGFALMSGEDTYITRLAGAFDFRCSFEPSLRLRHYISFERTRWRYLRRLMYGHGSSYVALKGMFGELPVLPRRYWLVLVKNFLYRMQNESAVKAIGMVFWDLGYRDAIVQSQRTTN